MCSVLPEGVRIPSFALFCGLGAHFPLAVIWPFFAVRYPVRPCDQCVLYPQSSLLYCGIAKNTPIS